MNCELNVEMNFPILTSLYLLCLFEFRTTSNFCQNFDSVVFIFFPFLKIFTYQKEDSTSQVLEPTPSTSNGKFNFDLNFTINATTVVTTDIELFSYNMPFFNFGLFFKTFTINCLVDSKLIKLFYFNNNVNKLKPISLLKI